MLNIIETILYSVVAFFGLWGVVTSLVRILTAQDSVSRKMAALSLLGAIVMILISMGAVYIRYFDLLSGLTVSLAAGALLVLNYIVFPKHVKFSSE